MLKENMRLEIDTFFKFFKKIGALRTVYKAGGGLSKRKATFKIGIPLVKKMFFLEIF
jgi:hypothetical protein